MKFLHLSDLHIGKRFYGFDLGEDQDHMLEEIAAIAASGRCDCIFIAGDLYDRAQPSGASIERVDRFLSALARTGKPVFLISGNHDSPDQIAYCGELLARLGVRVSRPFDGRLQRAVLPDSDGEIDIWMLPYLRPAAARRFFGEGTESCEQAVRALFDATTFDKNRRSILLAHQFVMGAKVCESEERIVGGLDGISASLFAPFCYTALGHLHRPQSLAGGTVCYAGAPLAYSFDEEGEQKSVVLGELSAEGQVTIEHRPLHPIRSVRTLRGTLDELCALPRSDDYIAAVLTDPIPPPDAMRALRATFPNLARLGSAVLQQQAAGQVDLAVCDPDLTLEEHFENFYLRQNGAVPEAETRAALRELLQLYTEEAGV